jgi:hypothetical protein
MAIVLVGAENSGSEKKRNIDPVALRETHAGTGAVGARLWCQISRTYVFNRSRTWEPLPVALYKGVIQRPMR